MATVEQKKAHTIGKEAARKEAEKLADSFKEKLGITWEWDGDTLEFVAKSGTAKGTKGTVIVTDNDIAVKIELPFLLSAFKGMVAGKVKEKLDPIS